MKTLCKYPLLFSLAATAGILDTSGYSLLNDSEGNNILCDLDPTCRKMSEEEVALVEEYFGDSIDYKQINVFDRKRIFDYIKFRTYGASASYNAIFLSEDGTEGLPDALVDVLEDSDTVHESTHIWQYQNEPTLTYIFGVIFENDYDYDVAEGAHFADYEIEQQASIIQHIHYYRQALKTPEIMEQTLRSSGQYTEEELPAALQHFQQSLCPHKLNPREKIAAQVFPNIELTACDSI